MTNTILEHSQADKNAPGIDEIEGDGWTVDDGRAVKGGESSAFNRHRVESLTFNNPFAQGMERVWYKGKIVYALDAGELEIPTAGDVKVAQEYQLVYSVELDKGGKAKGEPESVEGQLNIYDTVPGDDDYSPIWQFNYVVVPRDYEVNTIRSEDECLESGYTIHKSNDFEN